jgi:hypothetical protein
MLQRLPKWGALLVVAGALSAAAARAVDADNLQKGADLTAAQVVEKNVAARGGLDAWRKVQTMVWIGHIQSPHGPMPSLPFMMAQKRPNKTHFEINAMGQKTMRVFDGVSGWKVRAKGDGSPDLQPFAPQDARFARDGQGIDGPLIDYETKGNAVTLDGTEQLDGHKAYRLSVRLMSGQTEHVWVDAQSFLEIKSDRTAYAAAGTPAGTATTYYGDYKTFDGLQMPTVIETGVGSAQGTDRMVIERVVVNPPLQDRAFTRAAAEGPRQKHFAQSSEMAMPHPGPQPPAAPPATAGPGQGSSSQ